MREIDYAIAAGEKRKRRREEHQKNASERNFHAAHDTHTKASPQSGNGYLRLDPDWDSVRNDPRFQKLRAANTSKVTPQEGSAALAAISAEHY
jgi:hypothetical protein